MAAGWWERKGHRGICCAPCPALCFSPCARPTSFPAYTRLCNCLYPSSPGCRGDWGPHLVVVPTSVMLNWEMEFKKWCACCVAVGGMEGNVCKSICSLVWRQTECLHTARGPCCLVAVPVTAHASGCTTERESQALLLLPSLLLTSLLSIAFPASSAACSRRPLLLNNSSPNAECTPDPLAPSFPAHHHHHTQPPKLTSPILPPHPPTHRSPAFKLLTYYGSVKERAAKRQGWSKPNAFHVCITSYTLVLQVGVQGVGGYWGRRVGGWLPGWVGGWVVRYSLFRRAAGSATHCACACGWWLLFCKEACIQAPGVCEGR